MEYNTRDYFKEHADPLVKGFTIVDTDPSEGYQIAELFRRNGSENRWIQYWIQEETLIDRVVGGHCEKTGRVSEEKFTTIKSNFDGVVA